MKKIFSLLLLTALTASAAFRQGAVLTLTNVANLTNGITISVQASVRTGTNGTPLSVQFALTNRVDYQRTNLYTAIANNPFSGVTTSYGDNTNQLTFLAGTNVVLTVAAANGWASVSNFTTTVFSASAYITPYTVESNAYRTWQQSIAASNLEYATSQWSDTMVALSKYATTNTAQPLANKKLISPGHYGGDFVQGTFTLRDNVVFNLDGVGNFEWYHADSGQRWNMFPGLYAATAVVTVAMCSLAALLSIVKVLRLDPASVFKG